MSVTLTGTGGLFTRLGKFLKEINRTTAAYHTALDTGLEAIGDQFIDDDQSAIDGLFTTGEDYRGVHGTYLSALAGYSADAVIAQVHRDQPLTEQELVPALSELIRQMKVNSTTITQPTVTATPSAAAANLGDTVLITSVKNDEGHQLDMVFDENIFVKVTADGDNGGEDWSETLTVTGEVAVDATSNLWPAGSGASTTFVVTDSAVDDIIANGAMESWSGTGNNTPGSWTISTGTAGTQILRESSTVLRGNYSMLMDSDGSTLTTIRQDITANISPNTVYGSVLFARLSGTDANGILRMRLVNGSGTVISDDQGTNLSTTLDMNTGISTSDWTTMSAMWATPRQLPDTVYLEIGLSVSPAASVNLFLDGVTFGEATQTYAGGPYLFAASRSEKSAQDDYWTVAVATDGDNDTFCRGVDRLFNMREEELYFPSTTSSPTIADSLITA